MTTRSVNRPERAAGAVLAVAGVSLLFFTVVGLAPHVPDLGSANTSLAGAATMTLLIAGPMLAIVVLFTLACARMLWCGRRGAVTLTLVWIVAGGLFAAQALAGFGNVLWAIRAAVLEPARLLVRWPYLYWDPFLGSDVSGTPTEALPFGRIDDISFWLPGVIAVAAIGVALLLAMGWVARPHQADVSG